MRDTTPSGNIYSADIGKTIYNHNKLVKGTVTSVSTRYCAHCHGIHPCYVVQWDNGKKSLPCTATVETLPGGSLQIIL